MRDSGLLRAPGSTLGKESGLRAPGSLSLSQVAASGEVGIEEDVDAHEQDSIEPTHTRPEKAFLERLAVTWKGLGRDR